MTFRKPPSFTERREQFFLREPRARHPYQVAAPAGMSIKLSYCINTGGIGPLSDRVVRLAQAVIMSIIAV